MFDVWMMVAMFVGGLVVASCFWVTINCTYKSGFSAGFAQCERERDQQDAAEQRGRWNARITVDPAVCEYIEHNEEDSIE